MKRIIGVYGAARNGKDTICDHLANHYGFLKESFAWPIKEACRHIFGFNSDHLYGDLKETIIEELGASPRQLMQVIGTELFQYDLPRHLPNYKLGRTVWASACRDRVLEADYNKITLCDLRFPHEVDVFRNIEGFELWKVVRPGATISDMQHASEQEMLSKGDDYFDRVIINDGTLRDLYDKVEEAMR